MTTGNAIPGAAVLNWMNSEANTNTWAGNVGTDVGVVTCGGDTHNDVDVSVDAGEMSL